MREVSADAYSLGEECRVFGVIARKSLLLLVGWLGSTHEKSNFPGVRERIRLERGQEGLLLPMSTILGGWGGSLGLEGWLDWISG